MLRPNKRGLFLVFSLRSPPPWGTFILGGHSSCWPVNIEWIATLWLINDALEGKRPHPCHLNDSATADRHSPEKRRRRQPLLAHLRAHCFAGFSRERWTAARATRVQFSAAVPIRLLAGSTPSSASSYRGHHDVCGWVDAFARVAIRRRWLLQIKRRRAVSSTPYSEPAPTFIVDLWNPRRQTDRHDTSRG